MVKIFWGVSGLYGVNFDGSVFEHVGWSCRIVEDGSCRSAKYPDLQKDGGRTRGLVKKQIPVNAGIWSVWFLF